MLKHYFLTTIRTLRQNTLYTVLSVFGIALTFVFVSVMLLLAKSSKGEFIPPKYAERTWQVSQLGGTGTGYTKSVSKEQYETWIPKMKTPEIILVTNNEFIEFAVARDKMIYFTVQAVNDNYFDVCKLRFCKGRPINKQEIEDGIPVAVIDRYISSQYFDKSEDPIGQYIEVFGTEYKIVGVTEISSILTYSTNMTNASVWIPFKTVQTDRFYEWDLSYNISFTAKNKASIEEMQEEFNRVLDETNTAEGTTYTIPSWGKDTLGSSGKGLAIFSLLGCIILILIPALNILSLNISKSFDRSEEIAIRKTFGAPLYTIFIQLLLENIMITLVGALIGMVVTPFLLNSIDQMILGFSVIPLTLSFYFDWKTIFWISGPCVLLFGFISGSVPALITSKRNIVNVLKGEIS